MDVSPIGRTDLSGSATAKQPDPAESDSRRNAFIAAHQLNNLDIADREFSVVRDPESHRFVVVVVERSTGTVLDQFPPENILRMLSQVSSGNSKQTGETSE
ncbi:MAG: flagellar protein FlaG [Bryobacteraceae bacterium]